jgi:hypothetical protein
MIEQLCLILLLFSCIPDCEGFRLFMPSQVEVSLGAMKKSNHQPINPSQSKGEPTTSRNAQYLQPFGQRVDTKFNLDDVVREISEFLNFPDLVTEGTDQFINTKLMRIFGTGTRVKKLYVRKAYKDIAQIFLIHLDRMMYSM